MERLDRYFDTAFNAPEGIKKLRETILTLAIQGKLVSQDPKDRPACVLLKEIKAEKRWLEKEGKIKKSKPLPEIKPEEVPFELPETWEWVRLGDITNINRGITFPASEKTKEPAIGRIACLRTANVQEKIEWDDLLFIDKSFMKKEEQLINTGDIVMSMANSRELVGKVAIIDKLPVDEATFGGFLSVIRTYQVLQSYVLFLLRTQYARTKLIDSASQTTNIANISLGKLDTFLVPIPPTSEQGRIVAKIDQLMARCDELEKLRAVRESKRFAVHTAAIKQLLDAENRDCHTRAWQFLSQNFGELYSVKENVAELRKAILQLAMQGKLVPQDSYDPPASELLKEIEAEKLRLVKEGKIKKKEVLPEIKPEECPYELPKGWMWVHLHDVSNKIHYGYTASANYNIQDVRLLRITDIQENKVDWESVPGCDVKKNDASQFLLADNDILIARTGGTVGKSYLVQELSVDAVFASYLIRVIPSSRMDSRFLKYYVESPLYWKQLFAVCSGTGQPNVNGVSLSQLILPLPPSKEQHRIVTKNNQLMALCDELERKINDGTSKQTKLLNAVMAKV